MSTKSNLVFIVEDDLTFQTMMDDHLSTDSDYETRVFSSGEDALENLSQNPDIIILDYHLDSIVKDSANGMQILEAIKTQLPDCYVIVLSGQERFGVAAQMVMKGADEYILKDEQAFGKARGLIDDWYSGN